MRKVIPTNARNYLYTGGMGKSMFIPDYEMRDMRKRYQEHLDTLLDMCLKEAGLDIAMKGQIMIALLDYEAKTISFDAWVARHMRDKMKNRLEEYEVYMPERRRPQKTYESGIQATYNPARSYYGRRG